MDSVPPSCCAVLHPILSHQVKGYCIISGSISKQSVRLSLQTYCRTAVDWLDVIATQKNNLKHLTYLLTCPLTTNITLKVFKKSLQQKELTQFNQHLK